jgi:hypothetical protein
MGTNPVESSGGGFKTAELQTQTGDSEQKIQEIPLPDKDGSHLVEAFLQAQANNGSQEYVAERLFKKSFRKKGGSIQDTTDYTPESNPFTDRIGGLFSSSDFKLQSAGNGNAELAGVSPETKVSGSLNSSRDQSTISGIPTDPDFASCDTDPANGDVHYIFDDSDSTRISYYPPGGPKESVTSERVGATAYGIDLAVDSNGDLHACWVRSSDDALRYSKRSSGAWSSPETVDSSATMNRFSIDIDENDVPHIAYDDFTNNNVKYANRVGGSWSNETITTSGERPEIYVVSETEVGIIFNDSSVAFAEGQSGSFSVNQNVYSSQCFAKSVGGKLPNGDWSMAFIAYADDTVRVTEGTVSGGFTTSSSIASNNNGAEAIDENHNIQHIVNSGRSVLLVAGDNNGSNPYDARFYVKSGGSWSFDSEVAELGANWSGHHNDQYITVTDNGAGDSTIVSISAVDTLSATITWRRKSLQ